MARRRRKKTTTAKTITGKPAAGQPIVGKRGPGRNSPCPCGSKRKYKVCCGKAIPKIRHTTGVGYQDLRALYSDEDKTSVKEFKKRWGFAPNPSQLMVFQNDDSDEMKIMVVKALKRIAAREGRDYAKFIHGVETLGYLVTPNNEKLLSEEEVRRWGEVLNEHESSRPGDPQTAENVDSEG